MKLVMSLYLFIGGLLLSSFTAYAQVNATVISDTTQPGSEVCGAALLHNNLLITDKEYRSRIRQNEQLLQKLIEEQALYRTAQTSGTVYQIPVVVHIIHTGEAAGTGNNISDTQVHSAIEALNDIYRKKAGTYGDGDGVDMEFEFKLASLDPNCNPTSGIVRVDGSSVPNYASQGIKAATVGAEETEVKNLSRWPNTDYYNIWVVTEIDDNNGGAGIQGYAYFPGSPATRDGTVILNSAFGTMGTVKSYTNTGKTLAHELGHAFNLYHTFEGDGTGTTCPPVPNGCGSGQGDCVTDTEPHKRSASSCPTGTLNSCTGTTIGDVYKNFMDYSSQSCSNQFTAGQKARFHAAATNLRPGLLNASTHSQTTSQSPVAVFCVPSGTVAANNYAMGIYKVGINTAAVSSGGTVDENAVYLDRSCSQQFEIDNYTNFTFSVNTGPANTEDVMAYIDYNNNGDFTDAGELVFSSATAYNHSGSITPDPIAQANTPLRVRVISDYSSYSISGPCYVPQYGQVEEFTLKIISPLPVNMVSFTANKQQNGVDLHWVTAQEVNNQYFEIERSDEGKENWHTLGRISGKGTVTTLQEYSFSDDSPQTGTNYYRLKQVDADGKYEYSAIRTINFDRKPAVFAVYPNPSTGRYFLKFESLPESAVIIRVYNINGQIILSKSFVKANSADFTLESQPKGMYILEVLEGQRIERVKLVKQ